MFLQPEQLGRLHLRRDDAAHIAKNIVIALVDATRLGGCSVVHPHDDIPPGIPRSADRERTRGVVEHDQRAGGVKADAADDRGR